MISLVVVLLVVLVGCSSNSRGVVNYEGEDFHIGEPAEQEDETLPLYSDNGNEYAEQYPGFRSVQDFFVPIDITVLSGIWPSGDFPESIRFYPIGEILEGDTGGKASFVLFIEEGYRAEELDNVLRVTPVVDGRRYDAPNFMDITQVPNLTVDEAEQKILYNIDFANYLTYNHLPPSDDFPYVTIRLVGGGSPESTVSTSYIRNNNNGGVFIVTTQNSFGGGWAHGASFRNFLRTLDILTEADINNRMGQISTDDLGDEPMFYIIFIEGTPELVRYRAHTNEANMEGASSYRILVDALYIVEQSDSLLRITPPWDLPTDWPMFFMEITQIPNTTVEDVKRDIMSSADFLQSYDSLVAQPTAHFPFVGISMYDGFDRDNTVTNIYIKENNVNGVFVVTTQHSIEATGGIGVRFMNFLKTLELLD